MAREFLMPELAESVVEGEIIKWLVAEGEIVEEDQPLVEVMTDKVTVELPSPYAGVLERHLVKEGDVVPVHEPIARFAGSDRGGAASERQLPLQAREERSLVEPAVVEEHDDGEALSLFAPSHEVQEPYVRVRIGDQDVSHKPDKRVTGPYGRVLAVPAARKLARTLGIDIESVQGSGPNGRIRVEDVRAYHDAEQSAGATTHTPGKPTRVPAGTVAREERIPFRGLRRAIASQMMASHLESVRTLHVDEADVTELVAMRKRLLPLAERRGVKLSYLPFVMKAVVSGLRAFPMINACLDESAGEIVRKHYYHLGIAVATEPGLVVPVVRDVDQKSLLDLAAEVRAVADKARHGRLEPGDVGDGTFSITNIGNLGGLFSFPIINVPEAAILGVHSIKKRPVVLADDTIAARQMLYLSLSFDHRLVDGAEAARFTGHVIELLETPEALLLED
jgi:pyruvate dehydrogenase E2 component (dihydrolipoamide acetyltransferase)